MKKIFWGLALGISLSAFTLAFSNASEPTNPDDKADKIIHFGNMGGVMPDLDPEDVPEHGSDGAAILFEFCGQCHNVPGPGMRTVREWSKTYWRMYWRMHFMVSFAEGFRAPDYNQGVTLFKYLNRNAMQSVRGNGVDRSQNGAVDYLQTCSQCHELPNPTMHTAEEWPDTVNRMQGHIASMGRMAPNVRQRDAILDYLISSSQEMKK